MHILHLIQRYWPAPGGAELYLSHISEHLARAGHQVTVATTDALDFELFWDPRRRRVAEPEGIHEQVKIRRFPVRHLPLSPLAYPAIRRFLWLMSRVNPLPVAWLHRLARLTPWVPALWQWLAQSTEPFDLVAGMTICFEPLLEAGLRFARRRGIPYVSYPLTHLGAGPAPAQDALSRFYTMRHQVDLVRRSDAAVVQTPAERAFYVSHGMAEADILVAGAGIAPEQVLGGDGQRFREKHKLQGPLVLSLSSMSYDKGTVHTVEAVRRLWQAGRQVELVLIGALLEPFKQYLARLPGAERQRIRVLGSVSEQEKRDALAAATMLVMPSRTESFGIVYLEAWLYQKPVIGARTWGVTDVIHEGYDGLLVPFGEVGALSEAIAYLLDHPEEAAVMGARGNAKVYRDHLWTLKMTRIEKLYGQLVPGRDG